MEVHITCQYSEFCHIFGCASRVRTDKVGNELLIEACLAIDVVENSFEVIELFERRFAHKVQHGVARMFRCNFQTPRNMLRNHLFGILHVCLVDCLVAGVIENEVVAYAAAYETLLDARQRINSTIDFYQRAVVVVKILANIGMDA